MMPSLFQRRHYEWLAAFAREHLTGMDCVTLAEQLQRANPNFNRGRFLDACEWSGKLDPEAQRALAAAHNHT